MIQRSKLVVALLALALSAALSRGQEVHTRHIPFVGCRADGQVGPLRAPKGFAVKVQLPNDIADRLAFYRGNYDQGILGPRGWYCFEAYGSSGQTLFLSPTPVQSSELFAGNWKGLHGAAIILSYDDGGTSGRYGVADTIAKFFPDYMYFAHQVEHQDKEDGGSFVLSKLTPISDRIVHVGNREIKYETPANSEGLGTGYWLARDERPVTGVVLLNKDADLYTVNLFMRLPSADEVLTPFITQSAERLKKWR